MDFPWEIENDKQESFFRKFTIYDDSKLIQSNIFQIGTTYDYIKEINNSEISTGIMIFSLNINNILIYLCILDNRIFIIKQKNIPKYQDYFNKPIVAKTLIFITDQCKESFFDDLSSKDQILEHNNQVLSQQDIKKIKDDIIQSTIKKSQYRTLKMRQELLPMKYNSENDDYKEDDFFQIQSGNLKLCYNSKDQILNVLKYCKDEKSYKHEIGFYGQIKNTFPFICKIFGIIKRPNELPIIILEYVEGETLDRFILSEKKN